MNRILVLCFTLFALSTAFTSLVAQDIQCYLTAMDYVDDNLYENEVFPKIDAQGEKFIGIPKMLNSRNKKDKLATMSWAILHEDNLYLNMRYSPAYGQAGLYVQADITGRYCVIIMNTETDKTIKNGLGQFGYGIQYRTNGLFRNDLSGFGNRWEDENEDVQEFIIFDTEDIKHSRTSDDNFCFGIRLTKLNLNKVLELDLKKKDIRSLKFEEILDIIYEKNEERRNQE